MDHKPYMPDVVRWFKPTRYEAAAKASGLVRELLATTKEYDRYLDSVLEYVKYLEGVVNQPGQDIVSFKKQLVDYIQNGPQPTSGPIG